ncbi:MAG: hypothetical protein U5L96_04940 [Owenweeksia sp.]|nr:hypothetical protein [Owenweeksia sp.]
MYNFEYERAHHFYHQGWMQRDFSASGNPSGEVFLIDLGLNFHNQKRGYRKLQILNYNNGTYTLKIADLNGQNEKEFEVKTDSRYNYQFISFTKPKEVLSLEPPKEAWDLHFTKYMERLWDGADTLDYSVTGALLNPHFTRAYQDTLLSQDSQKVLVNCGSKTWTKTS